MAQAQMSASQTRCHRLHAPGRAGGEIGHRLHAAPAGRQRAFQRVLTIRAQVQENEVPAFTRSALHEVRAYIERHGLLIDGPPFVLSRPAPAHRVDVEAGWPTRGAPGSGRIQSGAIPASRLSRSDRMPS